MRGTGGTLVSTVEVAFVSVTAGVLVSLAIGGGNNVAFVEAGSVVGFVIGCAGATVINVVGIVFVSIGTAGVTGTSVEGGKFVGTLPEASCFKYIAAM